MIFIPSKIDFFPIFPGVYVFTKFECQPMGYRTNCNWTRTQNDLVLKRTLNHLAKLCSTSSKEFLDIQASIECRFTLKRVPDMTRTCSQWVIERFRVNRVCSVLYLSSIHQTCQYEFEKVH